MIASQNKVVSASGFSHADPDDRTVSEHRSVKRKGRHTFNADVSQLTKEYR